MADVDDAKKFAGKMRYPPLDRLQFGRVSTFVSAGLKRAWKRGGEAEAKLFWANMLAAMPESLKSITIEHRTVTQPAQWVALVEIPGLELTVVLETEEGPLMPWVSAPHTGKKKG